MATNVLGALASPLTVPVRILRDLDAISEAVRGLPEFERRLLARINDLSGEVSEVRSELAATRELVAELRVQVEDAVEHLPGHDGEDSRGPIARARDAISGQEH